MTSIISQVLPQVKEVIEFSQGISNTQYIGELLNRWYTAKTEFIDALGGNLTFKYPEKMSFEFSPAEKKKRLFDLIDYVYCTMDNYKLGKFIEAMSDCFYTNIMNVDYELPDGTVICAGTKIIKAFKYFEGCASYLEKIQNKASRLIQENKVEGYITISVHPLDYLSASENAHNWRSCHALDGEYRAGNLSYMLDSSTVMCYLSDEKDYTLPNFPSTVPWNSKKWRMWLYFSNDQTMMFAGRQYPFTANEILDKLRSVVFPKCRITCGKWSEWQDNYITHYTTKDGATHTFETTYVPVGNRLADMYNFIQDKSMLHFNDLLRSSTYTKPLYMYRENPWYYSGTGDTTSQTKFEVGSKVPCLICGEPLDDPERFVCSNCCADDSDDKVCCDQCGSVIYVDDAYWVEDTYAVCPQCAHESTDVCYHCGTRHYMENLIEENGELYCRWCHTHRHQEMTLELDPDDVPFA